MAQTLLFGSVMTQWLGIIWYPSSALGHFLHSSWSPGRNDWKGEICLPIVKNSCRECHLITNCQRTRLVIGMLLMDDDAGYCVGKWGLHGPASFRYDSWPSNALLLAVVPNATFSLQENLCLTGKLPFLGGLLRFHRTPEKSAANLCFESDFISKKLNENCCMIHIVLVIAVAFFPVVLSIQRRLVEFHYQT